jgi:hypothetical protein
LVPLHSEKGKIMPRPILIGKQRRITISEFAALCKGSRANNVDDASGNDGEDNGVFLQMVDDACSDDNKGEEEEMVLLLSKQLQQFQIQEDPSLSSACDCDDLIVVVGTLTLLAFAISQERIYHSTKVALQITSKLVHIVNALVSTKANVTTLTKSPTSLFQNLASLGVFPDDQMNNNEFVEHKLIPKYVNTTKVIIATHMLHELIVTSSIDLCIAALSVQRLRQPASQDIFTWYDTLTRPHRSSVTVANIMRVLLEGSKYTTTLSPDNLTNTTPANVAIVTVIEQIPTTHGAARDVIASAYKTLEIELNSVDDPKGLDAQTTTQHITMITVNILCTIVQELIKATNLRCCCQQDETITPSSSSTAVSSTDIVNRYESIVQLYMGAVKEEVALGLKFAQQERLLALEEFRQKEAKKAARAADFAAASSSATTNNANEFDGMSEAQIAKILKKRAQKALKQQQQQSNKSSAGEVDILATLFGMGTSSTVNLLLESHNIAQNAKQFEILVERLQRGGIQRKPKIPKGTRDFLPEQVRPFCLY